MKQFKGCRSQHIISLFPNGTIQVKENICSCDECISGNLINSSVKEGKCFCEGDNEESDTDSTDNEEDENESEDEGVHVNEIRADTMVDLIEKDSVVALYSHQNANGLFYLCKVVSSGVANENLTDTYEHHIKYLLCKYFEKVREKRGFVHYKLLGDDVLVPTYQIVVPSVEMDINNTLTIREYQFIADKKIAFLGEQLFLVFRKPQKTLFVFPSCHDGSCGRRYHQLLTSTFLMKTC